MHSQIAQQLRTRAKQISLSNKYYTKQKIAKIIKIQAFCRMYKQSKIYKQLKKKLNKRKLIVEELKSTEYSYINFLQLIVDQVMKPLKEKLDQQLYEMLFLNIPQILNLHKTLYQNMSQLLKPGYNQSKTKISPIIISFSNNLKSIYYKFCLEYKKSNQILRLLTVNNTIFKNHINHLRKSNILKQQLSSYLIKPIQRICKYGLLLREIVANTQSTHIDYQGLKYSLAYIQQIITQTNHQIQQFMMQQRQQQLNQQFGNLGNDIGRLIYEGRVVLIQEQKKFDCHIVLFKSLIFFIQNNKEFIRFYFDDSCKVKQPPPAKYFKNLIYISSKKRSLTLTFQQSNKKIQFLQHLKKTDFIGNQKNNGIYVDIEGCEQRQQSLFKKYTVYIIKITTPLKSFHMYPRFSQLIEVDQIIKKKIGNLQVVHLQKDDWIKSRKTKTIQMRKFLIKQFLTTILNQPEVLNITQILQILKIQQFIQQNSMLKNSKRLSYDQNMINIKILIAGQKPLTCWISEKAKISELKQQIAKSMDLKYPRQYQIFQIKDKLKKLIYQQEPVTKLRSNQTIGNKLFNLFSSQKQTFIYTRYSYLSQQQQESRYKQDKTRAMLQFAIIKSELFTFNIQNQLILSIIALHAKYSNLQIQNKQKVVQYLRTYENPPEYQIFLEYYSQIQQVVRKQNIFIPLIAIKILNNTDLYRCSQFHVDVYSKTLKQVRKELYLEEKIILGIKNQRILFLSEKRQMILNISYSNIRQINVYPSSLQFKLQILNHIIRLDTNQSYQIWKLIHHYKRMQQNQLIKNISNRFKQYDK